ncbi:hypothetical protein ABN236_18670 [Proteus sp. fly-1013]|uniref:hypothetical protein n=1 Tax=Proteus sp. fly-1013 TaxID=3136673 RepID=UPI0032DA032C
MSDDDYDVCTYNVPENKGRVSLKIPNRVYKIIEEVISYRIDNKEDDLPINRSAVAIEMMTIGAQVLKKSLKNDGKIEKAYSKEFETVVTLLLGIDYFSRINASDVKKEDYLKSDSPLLNELRTAFEARAKEILE